MRILPFFHSNVRFTLFQAIFNQPFFTHFLQEYFGLTPSAEQAFFRGLPALKFFFFPLYDRTVIRRAVFDPTDVGGTTVKPLITVNRTKASSKPKGLFIGAIIEL